MVEEAWRPGIKYRRAGVILSQLVDEGAPTLSQSLFDDPAVDIQRAKRRELMSVMDTLTDLYGKGIIKTASSALSTKWEMKRDFLTPCYTTNWDDVLVVH